MVEIMIMIVIVIIMIVSDEINNKRKEKRVDLSKIIRARGVTYTTDSFHY